MISSKAPGTTMIKFYGFNLRSVERIAPLVLPAQPVLLVDEQEFRLMVDKSLDHQDKRHGQL